MKKVFKNIAMALVTLPLFIACTEEHGTEPGTDSAPIATTYTYPSDQAGYNVDNDCFFRVGTNAAAKETYYLFELKDAKAAHNLSEDQYAEYVVKNGKKIDVKPSSVIDVVEKDLHGMYICTVVATDGSNRTSRSFEFMGLDYKPFGTGVYTSKMFKTPKDVDVEYSAVGDRYRIKDLWSTGHSLAFTSAGLVIPNKVATGATMPGYEKYGEVSITDKGSSYDKVTKTFNFSFQYTVSAGTIGTKEATLKLN